MKLNIYLTAAGAERVLAGGGLYSFDFIARPEAQTYNPEDINTAYWLCDVDVVLPSRETMTKMAVANLEQTAKKIQAEAGAKINEIEARIGKLLALENHQ